MSSGFGGCDRFAASGDIVDRGCALGAELVGTGVAARAILGACFHNSVRPDHVGEPSRSRYADELSAMAIAYLHSPDRRERPAPDR